MKIQILSDLHLEFAGYKVPKTDADVIVFAGDIFVGKRAANFFQTELKRQQKPLIYVLGNHEFYHNNIGRVVQFWRRFESEHKNFHLLNSDSKHTLQMEDVFFFGSTFWTNFDNGNSNVKIVAENTMNDFRLIDKFRVDDALEENLKCRSLLHSFLSETKNQKKVVITHHSPSFQTIENKFKDHFLNSAYCNQMDELIKSSDISAWIFGHQHHHTDLMIRNTRLVSNPRGYSGYEKCAETFSGDFCIEI